MKTEVKPRWTVDRQYANQCVGIDPDGRNWQIYIVNERNEAVARVQGATKEECEANAHRILNPTESVNQDLASALRFMCSQLEHLAKTHWPEPDEAEQFLKQCDALRCARSALKSAEQPANHAPSVNQRLVDAVRRAEHFLSSVAGHKHVICGNEGQVEIDGVWIDCADLQKEFRSAIQSAEQSAR